MPKVTPGAHSGCLGVLRRPARPFLHRGQTRLHARRSGFHATWRSTTVLPPAPPASAPPRQQRRSLVRRSSGHSLRAPCAVRSLAPDMEDPCRLPGRRLGEARTADLPAAPQAGPAHGADGAVSLLDGTLQPYGFIALQHCSSMRQVLDRARGMVPGQDGETEMPHNQSSGAGRGLRSGEAVGAIPKGAALLADYDEGQARREGWTVAECGPREDGSERVEIRRLGTGSRFADDESACHYVVIQARAVPPAPYGARPVRPAGAQGHARLLRGLAGCSPGGRTMTQRPSSAGSAVPVIQPVPAA